MLPLIAIAGLAITAASAAASMAQAAQGPGVSGRGKVDRVLHAQMAAMKSARENFQAAGDVNNPLFRQTAASEEIRLRRTIADGVATSDLMARKLRARGLTAGVRSDREDEGRQRAIAGAFGAASEKAGALASEKLNNVGAGMVGIAKAGAYAGQTAGTMLQAETAANYRQQEQMSQLFNAGAGFGQSMMGPGGWQGALDGMFGGGAGGGYISPQGQTNYPNAGGYSMGNFSVRPDMSWRGGR